MINDVINNGREADERIEKLREQADVEIAAILVLADIKNDFSGRKRLKEKYDTRVYSLLKDEDIQLALRKTFLS